MIDADEEPAEETNAVAKKGDNSRKDEEDGGKMKYDSTGTYHWCQARYINLHVMSLSKTILQGTLRML